MSAIPCRRPKVTVEAEDTASGPLAHRVTCHVPGCTFAYGPAVKTDAEQRATWHRQEHRDAVPDVPVERTGAGFTALCEGCGDGKYLAGRGEATEWVNHHLTTEHRLVTCP